MQRKKTRKADLHSPGGYDNQHELFFPEGETFAPAKYAKFKHWLDKNRVAFDWLMGNLHRLKLNGRGYCSADLVRALIRDHFPGSLEQTDSVFVVNNDIFPYLKRHIIYLKRGLNLFELRESPRKTQKCPHCGGEL